MLDNQEAQKLAQLISWAHPEWFTDETIRVAFALLNTCTLEEFQNEEGSSLVHLQRSFLGLVLIKHATKPTFCHKVDRICEPEKLRPFKEHLRYNFLNPILSRRPDQPLPFIWFRISPTEYTVSRPTAHQSMQAEIELDNWIEQLHGDRPI